jgi:hypothetical protein
LHSYAALAAQRLFKPFERCARVMIVLLVSEGFDLATVHAQRRSRHPAGGETIKAISSAISSGLP